MENINVKTVVYTQLPAICSRVQTAHWKQKKSYKCWYYSTEHWHLDKFVTCKSRRNNKEKRWNYFQMCTFTTTSCSCTLSSRPHSV